MPVPVITSDGSVTLYDPGLDEHYHSVHGAVQESLHVFINNGLHFCSRGPLDILEIGFGTGLNALLTAAACLKDDRIINYTALENFPLDEGIVSQLNHARFCGPEGASLFKAIHSCPWGGFNTIVNGFSLRKLKTDVTTDEIPGKYGLIYFDAFGPGKQPSMWTIRVFEKISALTVAGGVLVTYSSKGEVKRNLRACGFEVTRLPGPPGKRQMIRAVKTGNY